MKNSLDTAATARNNGAHPDATPDAPSTTASNGHHAADAAQIAAALGLTTRDGDTWRGPDPETGEGTDRFCLFPEGNATNRDGSRKYSRAQVLELARQRGYSSHSTPAPTNPARLDWKSATVYDYTDESGALLFQVGRSGSGDGKRVSQRRPDGHGGWIYKLENARRVLFRLPDVAKAQTVVICEGEKDTEAFNRQLRDAGQYGPTVATTNPQGAGKWRDEYSPVLAGKTVIAWPDADEPGERHGAQVCASVAPHAASVKRLTIASAQAKDGAADFFARGGTLNDFRAIANAAPDWTPTPTPHSTGAAETITGTGYFSLDEIGNGQRFAAKHGDDIRFCSVRAQWLIYWLGRWQSDEIGIADQRAKQVGRDVATEAAREADDDRRARLLKHALTLTKRATRETMLKDAASEPGMMVTPEQFDTNPHLFNCANVTLDLQSHEAQPHDARDLLTHQAPVVFDASAQCPLWRPCMARWIPDEATRDFLQDAAGVSLSGKVFDEFFIFLYGDGDNGKSTFLRVLEWLLGSYSHKTQAETIMTARDPRKSNAPAPELLALKGARLVTVHEIDSKHQLNAPLIKDLTGRDSITGRGLFEKRETTFEPQFTLWMFGNSKPRIADTSGGMWRRPRLINFGQPIPPNERDPQLADKLRDELPGILNWALEGLRRVQERGLIVPDAVLAATADYRAEQDPMAGFLADCCIIGPHCTAGAGELWAAWCDWGRENGEREGTQRAFTSELTRRKFESYRGSTGRRWRGIGLKMPENPEKVPLPPSEPSEPSPFPIKLPIENSYARDFIGKSDNPTVPTVVDDSIFDDEPGDEPTANPYGHD